MVVVEAIVYQALFDPATGVQMIQNTFFMGDPSTVCVEKVVFRDYPPGNEAGIPTQAMFESMIFLFPFGGIC